MTFRLPAAVLAACAGLVLATPAAAHRPGADVPARTRVVLDRAMTCDRTVWATYHLERGDPWTPVHDDGSVQVIQLQHVGGRYAPSYRAWVTARTDRRTEGWLGTVLGSGPGPVAVQVIDASGRESNSLPIESGVCP